MASSKESCIIHDKILILKDIVLRQYHIWRDIKSITLERLERTKKIILEMEDKSEMKNIVFLAVISSKIDFHDIVRCIRCPKERPELKQQLLEDRYTFKTVFSEIILIIKSILYNEIDSEYLEQVFNIKKDYLFKELYYVERKSKYFDCRDYIFDY
jgi:hypothetical protein